MNRTDLNVGRDQESLSARTSLLLHSLRVLIGVVGEPVRSASICLLPPYDSSILSNARRRRNCAVFAEQDDLVPMGTTPDPDIVIAQ
jgi:hypothetical protein